jgi:hypothetical protein
MNVWTDDMIRAFARLHRATPPLSFDQIAAELRAQFNVALTRNACIGKARRLGLPMRDNTPRPIIQSYTKPRLVQVGAPIAPLEAQRPLLREDGLTIYQLREGDCKWPLGPQFARPPFMYCGKPSLLGRSYCKGHTEKAAGYSKVRA